MADANQNAGMQSHNDQVAQAMSDPMWANFLNDNPTNLESDVNQMLADPQWNFGLDDPSAQGDPSTAAQTQNLEINEGRPEPHAAKTVCPQQTEAPQKMEQSGDTAASSQSAESQVVQFLEDPTIVEHSPQNVAEASKQSSSGSSKELNIIDVGYNAFSQGISFRHGYTQMKRSSQPAESRETVMELPTEVEQNQSHAPNRYPNHPPRVIPQTDRVQNPQSENWHRQQPHSGRQPFQPQRLPAKGIAAQSPFPHLQSLGYGQTLASISGYGRVGQVQGHQVTQSHGTFVADPAQAQFLIPSQVPSLSPRNSQNLSIGGRTHRNMIPQQQPFQEQQSSILPANHLQAPTQVQRRPSTSGQQKHKRTSRSQITQQTRKLGTTGPYLEQQGQPIEQDIMRPGSGNQVQYHPSGAPSNNPGTPARQPRPSIDQPQQVQVPVLQAPQQMHQIPQQTPYIPHVQQHFISHQQTSFVTSSQHQSRLPTSPQLQNTQSQNAPASHIYRGHVQGAPDTASASDMLHPVGNQAFRAPVQNVLQGQMAFAQGAELGNQAARGHSRLSGGPEDGQGPSSHQPGNGQGYSLPVPNANVLSQVERSGGRNSAGMGDQTTVEAGVHGGMVGQGVWQASDVQNSPSSKGLRPGAQPARQQAEGRAMTSQVQRPQSDQPQAQAGRANKMSTGVARTPEASSGMQPADQASASSSSAVQLPHIPVQSVDALIHPGAAQDLASVPLMPAGFYQYQAQLRSQLDQLRRERNQLSQPPNPTYPIVQLPPDLGQTPPTVNQATQPPSHHAPNSPSPPPGVIMTNFPDVSENELTWTTTQFEEWGIRAGVTQFRPWQQLAGALWDFGLEWMEAAIGGRGPKREAEDGDDDGDGEGVGRVGRGKRRRVG